MRQVRSCSTEFRSKNFLKEKSGSQQRFSVSPSDALKRLDVFVSQKTGITRSQVQKLIQSGNVLVNNASEKQNYKIKSSDIIAIHISEDSENESILIPEPVSLNILYMDEYIAVIDKPAGMVVYPAAGHKTGTLLNALAHHSKKLANIGAPLRPGVVHRLDKDTSGVLVIALDDRAYYTLSDQFKNRTINRKYLTLVYGDMKNSEGEIMLDIGRSLTDRKKMSTRIKRGKEAVTRWKVIQRFRVSTLIEARLGTGRTHQIRVHFSAIGHPVLGDKTYGKKTQIEINGKRVIFPRQMLHAQMLGFNHPFSGQYLEFSSPVPDDMKECIENLSTESSG